MSFCDRSLNLVEAKNPLIAVEAPGAAQTNVDVLHLVNAIAKGRRWLDDVMSGGVTDVTELCRREKCSVNSPVLRRLDGDSANSFRNARDALRARRDIEEIDTAMRFAWWSMASSWGR
jgi:hypothetical protein